MNISTRFFIFILFAAIIFALPKSGYAQKFIHPGINQSAVDLLFMRQLVLEAKEPWKSAFDRLKKEVDTPFVYTPYTHVLRGSYGKPNIGGDDLLKSAQMAYNSAIVWYITKDKKYADKAIQILNSWSPVLWDFDYNDAKLLAAWTGHLLCNAAEILRYNNGGWQEKDIDGFSNMLLTVYYPLLRHYYPQANGNWDGAIIHSIMAIGIFTDQYPLFKNAVDHYQHASYNGSLLKYIFPSGQCQETTRDQGHVQLGLGEFAGAAQVAYTQGVDLFSIADNRLALGYEYTAGFLQGQTPFAYGNISERAKALRDDYEYVYRHYTAKGCSVPFTKSAADALRSKASRSVLTSVRRQFAGGEHHVKNTQPAFVSFIAGAGKAWDTSATENSIIVSPGESIQQALDMASGTGRWVFFKAGIHKFPATLKIPGNVKMKGAGLKTILFLDPASGERDAMVNSSNDLHDVIIQDLVIEASNKTDYGTDPNGSRSYRGGYNRGGIVFRAQHDGQMKNIKLVNVSILNSTYNGIFISGAQGVSIIGCDITENGGNAVPGPHIQHNVLLTHCSHVTIDSCRIDTSPFGSGVALDHANDVFISHCEIARNADYGILITEGSGVVIKENLLEANDRCGVFAEYLFKGSENIKITNNIIQYNGCGVVANGTRNILELNNKYAGNGSRSSEVMLNKAGSISLE